MVPPLHTMPKSALALSRSAQMLYLKKLTFGGNGFTLSALLPQRLDVFMDFADRELMCVQCGSMFAFSADEQRFFLERGFTNDPKRCKQCKAKTANGRQRIETRVTCSGCGNNTTVPFKPTGIKPVLCRVCFAKQLKQPGESRRRKTCLGSSQPRVMQITSSEPTLPCNGQMPIPSLETIFDRELTEKIISQSAEIIPQDGILFRQGEPADCLYFVKSGEASLTMQAGEKEVKIRARQGSLLGIPAIVGNQPYSMTGSAGRDAEIFRLSSVVFNDLIKTEAGMQHAVLLILAGEVRVARQALTDLSLWSE